MITGFSIIVEKSCCLFTVEDLPIAAKTGCILARTKQYTQNNRTPSAPIIIRIPAWDQLCILNFDHLTCVLS
jgi:hypothetical protein